METQALTVALFNVFGSGPADESDFVEICASSLPIEGMSVQLGRASQVLADVSEEVTKLTCLQLNFFLMDADAYLRSEKDPVKHAGLQTLIDAWGLRHEANPTHIEESDVGDDLTGDDLVLPEPSARGPVFDLFASGGPPVLSVEERHAPPPPSRLPPVHQPPPHPKEESVSRPRNRRDERQERNDRPERDDRHDHRRDQGDEKRDEETKKPEEPARKRPDERITAPLLLAKRDPEWANLRGQILTAWRMTHDPAQAADGLRRLALARSYSGIYFASDEARKRHLGLLMGYLLDDLELGKNTNDLEQFEVNYW